MGLDLLGPLRIVFVLVIAFIVLGPGMWIASKLVKKTGADPNKDSTTVITILLGVLITALVGMIGRGQGWWGK